MICAALQNALSAIAIAQELGLGEDIIRKAFVGFKGVKRRFTKVGVSGGVTIIDDYAHHPVEIKTVLEAARQATSGKIIAVMQPHRYSRLSYLFDEFAACFKGCDQLIIAPVYGAGENSIEGATSENLAKTIRLQGDVQNVFEIEDAKELPYLLRRIAKSGDIVLCLGAGSITYWAASLPTQLDPLWQEEESQIQEVAG